MPITKGAKKALRASDRKAVFNLRRKRVLKTEVKNIRDLIKDGKVEEAQKSSRTVVCTSLHSVQKV